MAKSGPSSSGCTEGLGRGFRSGTAGVHGENLSRRGDGVLVTLNHRLNILGDRSRTLMRHWRLTLAFAMGLLTLVVIVPACRGGLVSAARCSQLLLPICCHGTRPLSTQYARDDRTDDGAFNAMMSPAIG